MKIGYISVKNLITSGGVEKYTWEMSIRMAERGHQIYIFTTDKVIPVPVSGIHVIHVPSIGGKFLEKMTGSFFATIKAISMNLDIYHFHAFGAGMFAFLPRLFGKRTISQGHGIEWKRSKWSRVGKFVLKVTELLSVKFCTHVMAVSKTQADDINLRYGREVMIVPGGISPPERISAKIITEKFGLYGNDYIIFVARLVPEKGVHYLIDAYKKLGNTDKKLVIVGDAEAGSQYKKMLLNSAKDSPNIIFTGFQFGETLRELFSNAYLYVLPSELEGLSISLLEAMSYGLCCLVSDIPENLEAIESRYGVSFVNKSAESLAMNMEKLLAASHDVACLGRDASNHVIENYNWNMLSARLEAYYLKICARPSASGDKLA